MVVGVILLSSGDALTKWAEEQNKKQMNSLTCAFFLAFLRLPLSVLWMLERLQSLGAAVLGTAHTHVQELITVGRPEVT